MGPWAGCVKRSALGTPAADSGLVFLLDPQAWAHSPSFLPLPRPSLPHPSWVPGLPEGSSSNHISLPELRHGHWLPEAPWYPSVAPIASPPRSSPRGPLPPGVRARSSCCGSSCPSVQAMPRRARSMGRRPGRWPPSLADGSGHGMGLVGALEWPGSAVQLASQAGWSYSQSQGVRLDWRTKGGGW